MSEYRTIESVVGQISPMIAVGDAKAAIDFYRTVFGAAVFGEVHEWEGKIGHAELFFGESKIMVADEFPDFNVTPGRLGGTPVMIHLTVADVDEIYEKCLLNGAKGISSPKDEPFGRTAKIRDPFGHIWFLWMH